MSDLAIRLATVADTIWISTLLAREFALLHQPDVHPEDMEMLVEKNFTHAALAADLAREDRRYLVAEWQGQPQGIVRIGPPTLKAVAGEAQAGEMSRFYLEPAVRSLGIGSQLVRAALAEAQNLGFRSVWIHVYKKNPRALAFYERLGFQHRATEWLELPRSRPEGWVLRREIVEEVVNL